MITKEVLKCGKVSIRCIELSDCNENYLRWLNDEETNRYLETRWNEQTNETIKDFVNNIRGSNHSYLFAIMYENQHIGNIKVGPINYNHKYADVSYFIGEKTMWGKGIATKAINLACDFAFNFIGLNKLWAGAYEDNVPSQKALIKNHFSLDGKKRKQYLTTEKDGTMVYKDLYEYGLLSSEFIKDKENE